MEHLADKELQKWIPSRCWRPKNKANLFYVSSLWSDNMSDIKFIGGIWTFAAPNRPKNTQESKPVSEIALKWKNETKWLEAAAEPH